MARHHISEPRVKEVIDRLVDQFVRFGSVNALADELTERLGDTSSKVYPNRLHGLLAEDPTRSVNSATLESIEGALASLESETFVLDDALKQRVTAEVAALPRTTTDPVAAVAAATGLPLAVVRKLADRAEVVSGLAAPGETAREPDWHWQDDAVASALRAIRKTPTYRAGLVIPTGGGKTRIALRIALAQLARDERPDSVVIWITHRRRLHLQARRALQQLLRDGEGIPDGSATIFAKRIRFVMVNDAATELALAGDNLSLVIVDEAHHAAAPSYEPVFDAVAPALFLTATPNRSDALPIGIDEISYTITYRELFERACLVEPVFEPPLDLRGLDWSEPAGLRDLADYLLDRTESDFGKVLVAVSLRDRAEVLYDAIVSLLDERPDHPLSSEDVGFVHAERSSGTVNPADFLDEFTARPKGILVATSQLVGEGYDDRSIDSVVVTYPSTSIGHLMQVAGRALRSAHDKASAHVVQVRESPLEYHFDQRWLYQDISDALRPALADVTFGSAADRRDKVLAVLNEHRVPANVVARVEDQLAALEPAEPMQLMLTGVPYFASVDEFGTDAEWGAIAVIPEERHRFVQVFNDVSSRVDDIKEHGAYLAQHLTPDTRSGSLWKSYVDLVTAMEYARREITGVEYAGADYRPYQRGRSTSWLRYVSLKFEPAVPLELDEFLRDAVNRDAVLSMYLDQQDNWAASVKIELPLSGTYAYLLDPSQASWLHEERAGLMDALRASEGLSGLGIVSNWAVQLQVVPVPQGIVSCFDQLTRPERHAAQYLELRAAGAPLTEEAA